MKNKTFKSVLSAVLAIVLVFATSITAFAGVDENSFSKSETKLEEYELVNGTNTLDKSVSNKEFNVVDGKVLEISSSKDDAIVIDNCVFNVSGNVMNFTGSKSGIDGGYEGRIAIANNVTFNDCTFNFANGGTNGQAGTKAGLIFLTGKITLNNSKINSNAWQGQFMTINGSADVIFNKSIIENKDNINGYACYAIYNSGKLTLNQSKLIATGMKPGSYEKVNIFYGGDSNTNYDSIILNNSIVDFHDNNAGGFAINDVNVYVKNNSQVNIINNSGNASNSGFWYIDNSDINIIGNKGQGFLHINDEINDSNLTLLHNGGAGYYILASSNWNNTKANIRCNGEQKIKLSTTTFKTDFSGGDTWLNDKNVKLTLNDCENAWLGAVGTTGKVVTNGTSSVIAYDLDNLYKSAKPVLTDANVVSADEHILFANPNMKTPYARGTKKNKLAANAYDINLFDEINKKEFIKSENAKFETFSTSQLSHHKYDFENGKVTDEATPTSFGVMQYACDVCDDYKNITSSHKNSFNCNGTYVYAPLVGVTFDANGENVENLPKAQTSIEYGKNAVVPSEPTREGCVFDGWYTDKECTTKFDFEKGLTDNWTTVYAKWLEPGQTIDGSWVNMNPAMGILQPGMAIMTPGMVDYTGNIAMGILQPGMAIMTPGMVDYTGNPAMGELQPGMIEMTPGMVDITNHPAMGELQTGEKLDSDVEIPNTGLNSNKSVASVFGAAVLSLGLVETIRVIKKRNK